MDSRLSQERALDLDYQLFSQQLDTTGIHSGYPSQTVAVSIPQKTLNIIKTTTKQQEKTRRFLEQAAIRHVFEPDRQISLPKSYFKFPKIDFYLNLECLLKTNGGEKTIEESNLSVINLFKRIEYSEVSKKTNGVHIYFADKLGPEIPLEMMINRLRSQGNSFLHDISSELEKFCSQIVYNSADSDSLTVIPDVQKIQTLFQDNERTTIQNEIDGIFNQNKFRPMLIWRGVNLEFASMHINESFLQLIHYTPEEFQMEIALSGIPMIWSSFNYREWITQIMKSLVSFYSIQPFKQTHKGSGRTSMKELLTQEGKSIFMEFEQYNMNIGQNKIIIEEATQEVILPKRKTKKKGQLLSITNSKDQEVEKEEILNNLTDQEKYFINNHYFKIQDFDFNKNKVCKIRLLQQEIPVSQEKQSINISA